MGSIATKWLNASTTDMNQGDFICEGELIGLLEPMEILWLKDGACSEKNRVGTVRDTKLFATNSGKIYF